MLLLGTLLVLITLSAAHWIMDSKNKIRLAHKVTLKSTVSWSAQAIVLGLSVGSLSLSSFEKSDEVPSVYDSLNYLFEYGLVLLMFFLIMIVLIKYSWSEKG